MTTATFRCGHPRTEENTKVYKPCPSNPCGQVTCRGCANARNRRWSAKNPEKLAKLCHNWNVKNLDRNRERVNRWKTMNPGQYKALAIANAHRRRALEAENGGSFTAQEWQLLKAKYGNRCLCCGRTEETLVRLGLVLAADHVVPVKLGGTSFIENIQPLCHSRQAKAGGCNNTKAATHVDYRLSPHPLCRLVEDLVEALCPA